MRRFIIAAAAIACMAGPGTVHAQTVRSPSGQLPFQPAPVPSISDPGVAPALRAGGALDAGPINSSPFSGETSTVLEGTQAARALRLSRPEVDPAPAVGYSE